MNLEEIQNPFQIIPPLLSELHSIFDVRMFLRYTVTEEKVSDVLFVYSTLVLINR